MAKCIQCGSEMYTSPASFKCFGCATGYKSRTPTSSPVVPSDCVSKADLLKIVEEIRADEPDTCYYVEDRWRIRGRMDVVDQIEKLLEGE